MESHQNPKWADQEMSEQNPYASPSVIAPVDPANDESRINFAQADSATANAIIVDARGFWIVFLLSIPCFAFGPLMALVFVMRLVQWNQLAKKYPQLLDSDVTRKSFEAKFKAARWKLITGVVVGVVSFPALIALYVLSFSFTNDW